MSRELKFRAWSLGNKMKGIEPHYIEDFAIDAFYGTPKDIFDGNRSEDGIECIEQYTGLKDKNGKEIYEGDIVDKKYDNLAIFDRNGVVGMGYLYDSDGYNNGTIYGWKAGDSSLADVCDACEVIGNIHENPELLGEK